MKVQTRPRLYRRRQTAEVLNTSITIVKKLENRGLLRKVRLGGVGRDVYNPVEDVEKIAAGGGEIHRSKRG